MNAIHTNTAPHRDAAPHWDAAFVSPHRASLADEVTLAALTTAISSTRCFVRITVHDWGLHHLLSDVECVTVALVARAVETTGNPDPYPRWSDLDGLPTIGVRLSTHNAGVLIQVRDSDPTAPRPARGAYADRHLAAVHELSRQWNWYRLDSDRLNGGGKVMWADLSPRHTPTPQPLPQRAAHYLPIQPEPDVFLLQKVLDGLHRLDT